MTTEIDFAPKKVMRGILAKLGYILCGIVFLFNVLYNFVAEASFSVDAIVRLSTDVIIYLVSIWTLFLLTKDIGKADGRGNEQYTTAKERYAVAKKEAFPFLAGLSAFCIETSARELEESRRELLELNDVPYKEYTEKYRGMPRRRLPKTLLPHQRKAIRQANKVKPHKLSPKQLLAPVEVTGRNHHAEHPAKAEFRGTVLRLLYSSVTAVLAANIVYTVTTTDNPQTLLVQCLWRVFLLLLSCVNGYRTGFYNITNTAVNYMQEQSDTLERFCKTQDKARQDRQAAHG